MYFLRKKLKKDEKRDTQDRGVAKAFLVETACFSHFEREREQIVDIHIKKRERERERNKQTNKVKVDQSI